MSTAMTPSPTKIMIIRHGEKAPDLSRPHAGQTPVPAGDGGLLCGPPYGVTPDGIVDCTSLSVRGWQRAGALVRLFAPVNNVFVNPLLAKPTYLYAMQPEPGHSVRPPQTIMALAEELCIQPNLNYPRCQEKDLWDDIKSRSGVILICWEHQNISEIVKHFPLEPLDKQDKQDTPGKTKWPGNRFDLVWVFDLDPISGSYRFTATTQQILPGDSPKLDGNVK